MLSNHLNYFFCFFVNQLVILFYNYQSLHKGIVNLKSLPFPNSLSTQIFPLCFSTNSLQSNKPKPVPFSFAVPSVVIF